MDTHHFIAFDFGAESGRCILGSLNNNKISLREISRFPTGMMTVGEHFHWNIFRLYEEMKKSLKICAAEKINIESMALDTWGVDYSLLASDGSILSVPYAYRDPRTNGAMESLFKIIPREKIYELTGIQFLQLNTLFQLHAQKKEKSPLLDVASDLLFMPDTFNYLFTGIKKSEFTFATTSQLYNPVRKNWDPEIFKALGINIDIMQDIVKPGTVLGDLSGRICKETGIDHMLVTAVASHDTGSAIVSIPAEDENFAYISSGTWSLMGIETHEPIISDKSLKYNFTNEGGAEGTFRFLKNIMGLWLVQECKHAWASKNYTYPQLVEIAQEAEPFKCLIDPDANDFLNPENMPEAIRDYCKKTGQPVPDSDAQIVRCVFESLALKYREVMDQLKELAVKPINKLHIIGGGTQNELLCQYAANATGVQVITGPAEATATGNIMMQALALGYVKSLPEIRKIIKNSFDYKTYQPQKTADWNNAYQKFLSILNK